VCVCVRVVLVDHVAFRMYSIYNEVVTRSRRGRDFMAVMSEGRTP
jgi:hypothetical protein